MDREEDSTEDAGGGMTEECVGTRAVRGGV